MTEGELTQLFASLGVMLGVGRLAGEAARKVGQPAVLGEIAVGVLLGPTLAGWIAPDAMGWLFPAAGPVAGARGAFQAVGVTLFLLVAGLELDAGAVGRVGAKATPVASMGMLVPFVLGVLPALAFPWALGWHGEGSPFVFALFVGIALAISALPVIARTLIDLELYRTDIGMIVMASAVLQDLVGWSVFGVVLALAGHDGGSPLQVLLAPMALAVAALTVGRWLADRAVLWVQVYGTWPGAVLGLVLTVTLLLAATAQALGSHAIFGGFLAGAAFGGSQHLRERTRATIDHFVSYVFAPLFFVGLGLGIDLRAAFDPGLTALVSVIATAGKIAGCMLGGRIAGLGARESLAIGIAMNARGAMEIVMAATALRAGLIDLRLFVALATMAVVTSAAVGPALQRVLRTRRSLRFADHLSAPAFLPHLEARSADDAIRQLGETLAGVAGLPAAEIVAAVRDRERAMPTGLPGEIAVPHAAWPGLTRPLVAVGLSSAGVDFGSPDGQPARVVCLVLTPDTDMAFEIELLADIGRTLHRHELREALPRIREFAEFVALVRSGGYDRAWTTRPPLRHRPPRHPRPGRAAGSFRRSSPRGSSRSLAGAVARQASSLPGPS